MTERKHVEDLIFNDSFEKFGFERRRLFTDKNLKFYQLKERDNRIVIIPPIYEPELVNNEAVWKSFGIALYRHDGMTPNKDSFPCVNLMRGERCPFCEKYIALKNTKEKAVYKPRVRGLIWVVDVSSKETEAEGVKLWVFGWATETFLSFRKAVTDPETNETHNIFKDPRVFYFDAVEKGQGTFRSLQVVAPRLGSRTVDLTKFEEWKRQVKPFSEIINWPTEDELEPFFRLEDASDMPTQFDAPEFETSVDNDLPEELEDDMI